MHYRSIFISDLHLLAYGSKAEELLEFLTNNTCDNLYLVGDILDIWKLKRYVYIPNSHIAVIIHILTLAKNGINVFYILGNHDEIFRDYLPINYSNIKVLNEVIHTTVDGKQLLVIHGDQFDSIMANAKWLMYLGDIGYDMLMRLNNIVHFFRNKFGYRYWSLSKYLKNKTKSAVKFISKYENTVIQMVKSRHVDGVICGHIHCAEIKTMNDFIYINCGDWVESCTAITEDYKGNFLLYKFHPD